MNFITLIICILIAAWIDKILSSIYKRFNNYVFNRLIKKQKLKLELGLLHNKKVDELYEIHNKINFYQSMLIK